MLPGFETELVAPVVRKLSVDGITIITEANVLKAEQGQDGLNLYYVKNAEQHLAQADYAIVTVGRKPNTDGALGLERIGLRITDQGMIVTDEQCRTMIPYIFAIGDITNGPCP